MHSSNVHKMPKEVQFCFVFLHALSCIIFTCRFWWHIVCLCALGWICTHLPKLCRQMWSVWAQTWEHTGRLRTKQLEQVVCWQKPPHSRFSTDTNLQWQTGSTVNILQIIYNLWLRTTFPCMNIFICFSPATIMNFWLMISCTNNYD